MKRIYKSLMTLALALVCSASATSQVKNGEILFGSYIDEPNATSKIMNIGMRTAGDFGLAYKIPAEFAGQKVQALMIPVQDPSVTTDMKAFLSKELNATNSGGTYTFTPDTWQKNIKPTETVTNGLYLYEVRLDEPVEIPAEGLYMGYTFTIKSTATNMHQFPIPAYSEPYISNPEMLRIFYSGGGWGDQTSGSALGTVSACLLAAIDGEPKSSASITGEELIRIGLDNTSAELTVTNYGWDGIHDIDYTVNVAGQTSTGSQHFSSGTNLASIRQYGNPGTLQVDLPQISEMGDYPITITIDKVNGEENPNENKVLTSTLRVLKKIPLKRPVVEETTCTGCGYCPRGFYGLEVLKRTHPESIAISYHNQGQGLDPMVCDLYTPSFGGNPSAFVDRIADVNNFYDSFSAGFVAAWESRLKEYAPADLEVKAEWVDESKEAITMTATATFPESLSNAKYRIDFAILQDGMTGTSSQWAQANYYSGQSTAFSEPEWEVFGKGGNSVRGLTFNDVAIFIGNRFMRGYANSVPTEIKANEPITFSKTVNLDDLRVLTDYKGTKGGSLVQRKDQLRVVAILVSSGEGGFPIANGAMAYLPGYDFSGVEELTDNVATAAYPVAYYDITGRKVANPEKGIYIVKYSDGSVVKEFVNK